MTKVFISQPMGDRDYEEVKNERIASVKKLQERIPDFEIVNVIHEQLHMYGINEPLYMLSESLKDLARAEVAVFVGNWECAKSCQIEYECAIQYGIKVINLEKE